MNPANQTAFELPAEVTSLTFSGERFTIEAGAEIAHEHYHRYLFALPFCRGRSVLDIACGEGYGTRLLSQVASAVVGVDADQAAIKHAQENYAAPNVRFIHGNATEIEAPDGAFDVVVSFETLEHLREHEEFFAEIRRVLRRGGVLVMSTPDRDVYSPPGSEPNPFHVRELSRQEFDRVLRTHFRHVMLVGQRAVLGSMIAPDAPAPPVPLQYFQMAEQRRFEQTEHLPGAMYEIGLASDHDLPVPDASVLIDPHHLSYLHTAYRAELERVWGEVAKRDALIAESQADKQAGVSAKVAGADAEPGPIESGALETPATTCATAEGAPVAASALAHEEAAAASGATPVLARVEAETLRERLASVEAASATERQELLARVAAGEASREALKTRVGELEKALQEQRAREAALQHRIDMLNQQQKPLGEAPSPVQADKSTTAKAPAQVSQDMTQTAAGITSASSQRKVSRLPQLIEAVRGYVAIRRSGEFDAKWYLEHYEDVRQAGIDPLWHFVRSGWREHRQPSAAFNTRFYLLQYPDVAAAGVNPLHHYLRFGRGEGRLVRPTTTAFNAGASARVGNVPTTAVDDLSDAAAVARAEAELPALVALSAARSLAYRPLVSVLMPTYNTPAVYLEQAVRSVMAQGYCEWELCIVDDGSTSAETLATLDQVATLDSRIRVQRNSSNAGISGATNDSLALARGEFVCMLDHDDELTANALLEVVRLLNEDRTLDVVYTDQDYVEADGTHADDLLKPDWSPMLFRGVMFVGHLLVVRRSLALEIGGFDPRFNNVQDFEFMLRVSERTGRIGHVPKVLYHWRKIPGSVALRGDAKANIEALQSQAVTSHLARLGIPLRARPHDRLAHRAVLEPLRSPAPCKVIVLVTSEMDARVVEQIQGFEVHAVVIPGDNPAATYEAIAASDAACVVQLGAGISPSPGWLARLAAFALQSDTGCVSGIILSSSGVVVEAGLVLDLQLGVVPAMVGAQPDSDGYAGSLSCTREVSAVSGRFAAVSRAALDSVGGVRGSFRTTYFCWADLAMRCGRAGLRNLVCPQAQATATAVEPAPSADQALDRLLFRDAWDERLSRGDPYYNRGFDSSTGDYRYRAT